ncbi:hypothetical protein A8C75_01245 [Marinobacterium aestuarii]|uniref:Nucleoside-diphosphate sugar epimerase n=1 Tax=Marinobacterium aestuarii TaxID=1821621 RepID=A0A1A9ETN3_9GAMM|nr:ELM1/GtrOC1 family putative glycosyltransferase [Marinobacterium aestuarii]ANG61217.1 hypothetical protein A8C75_01245 [Marinobacterium aestuarii]
MNTRPSLRVLLLCDGLPGHANQARGLVQWMSARYDIECTEIEVRLRLRALARLLLPWLLNRGPLGWRLVRYFYAMPDTDANSMQLIVSAGGNTSFLNVALARIHRIPNVFLGSKRRLHSHDFSAHLTLEPTGERNNLVMELVPTLTDIEQQAVAGVQLRQTLGIDASERVYALVIGGDGAGFQYDEAAWKQVAALVESLAQRDGCRWLLTTSRRTGAAGERLLRALIDPALLLDSVWWSESPRKVMNAYLGAADAVFVTADSMSMLNECIASAKPTVLLEPCQAQPDARYRGALERFVAADYCRHHRLVEPLPALGWQAPTSQAIRGRLLDALERQLALDSK